MSRGAPYTYYSCPCTDSSIDSNEAVVLPSTKEGAAEHALAPHSKRAQYALYPIEHLLFCNDCHQIRCPRCWYEEAMYYFCSNCLFETSKSTIHNETNRCTRSCYQCPICISTLAINNVRSHNTSGDLADFETRSEDLFLLSCPYCAWSTLEIGIKFAKSTNISAQLAKLHDANSAEDKNATNVESKVQGEDAVATSTSTGDVSASFANLANFYKAQLAELSNNATQLSLSSGQFTGLESLNLSRLLNTYVGGNLKSPRVKSSIMREAESDREGLALDTFSIEDKIIRCMHQTGWSEADIYSKREKQTNDSADMLQGLNPTAFKLQSKRARRCRSCRHQLAKQDDKRHSTRFKIRLVAANHIPSIRLRALDTSARDYKWTPGNTVQFLLTFHNPLFDPLKITLATPPITPGYLKSKVTILCPQFEVGASSDVWEEALDLAGDMNHNSNNSGRQAEAGKVWDRGRNWTSVVCEVVPGTSNPKLSEEFEQGKRTEERYKDACVLEIPVFVRMEYETEDASLDSERPKFDKERKVSKELTFWCVLGAGYVV